MTIEAIIDALVGAPNDDDCLSRVTFADALSIPFVMNVIHRALSDQDPGPDYDEAELRAEELRAQAHRLVRQLALVAALRENPASPFMTSAHAELDHLAAGFILDLASFGAVALLNADFNY